LRIAEIFRQLRRGIPAARYTREYFLSEQCDGFHEFLDDHGLSYVKQRLVERIGAAPAEGILEIGCGRGEVLLACAKRDARIFGVDYARDAIRLTRETCDGRARLAQADATALPFQTASFRKVFLAGRSARA
jgi:ubiquinone/menaquinone biosynthesis C-methylase UbiE